MAQISEPCSSWGQHFVEPSHGLKMENFFFTTCFIFYLDNIPKIYFNFFEVT